MVITTCAENETETEFGREPMGDGSADRAKGARLVNSLSKTVGCASRLNTRLAAALDTQGKCHPKRAG